MARIKSFLSAFLFVLAFVSIGEAQPSNGAVVPAQAPISFDNNTINAGENSSPSVESLLSSNNTCAFIDAGARYFRAEAQVTLQGTNSSSVYVNDALVRVLLTQLQVSSCQLSVSQGTNCTSGTQNLPCADPIFYCAKNVVISLDIYNAVMNGDCSDPSTNSTLLCTTIAADPSIVAAVNSGTCRPKCLSDASGSQNLPVGCLSFDVSVASPTNADASAAAATLSSIAVQNAMSKSLSTNFSQFSGQMVQFMVVAVTVTPAIGYGPFPPPPPPLLPILPAVSVTINATSATLDASGNLVFGPWSNCSSPSGCGAGVMTRSVSCYSSAGTMLPLEACPGGSDAETFKTCNTSVPCGSPHWQVSAWSPCSSSCGGGNATRQATCMLQDLHVPAQQNGSTCPASAGPQPAVERTCNTAPCFTYTWNFSPWSACSASCGGGTRSRHAFCVNSTGIIVPESYCINTLGAVKTNESCNIGVPCDFCANTTCLGRGTCDGTTSTAVCNCTNGDYTGPSCEVPTTCASGVVDSMLQCCPSGLVDVNGSCCSQGDVLDASGHCCGNGQRPDACGVCGGSGQFLDMQGTCCQVADANGLCCASGKVDACGVCNGLGTSCVAKLNTNISVPATIITGGSVQLNPLTQLFQTALTNGSAGLGLSPSDIAVTSVTALPTSAQRSGKRRLLLSLKSTSHSSSHSIRRGLRQAPPSQATASFPITVTVTISPPTQLSTGNMSTGNDFSAAYAATRLFSMLSSSSKSNSGNSSLTGVEVLSPVTSERAGVCGNGICEIGERTTVGTVQGTCPSDCGLPAVPCVQGCGIGGSCLPSSGVCLCYVGYMGPSCAECSPGFVKSGGACVTSVTAQNLVSPAVLTPNGTALVTGQGSTASQGTSGTNGGGTSGTDVGAIVGGVLGGVLGLIALLALFLCLRARARRQRDSTGSIKAQHDFYGRGYDFGTEEAMVKTSADDVGLREKYGLPSARTTYNVHVTAADPGTIKPANQSQGPPDAPLPPLPPGLQVLPPEVQLETELTAMTSSVAQPSTSSRLFFNPAYSIEGRSKGIRESVAPGYKLKGFSSARQLSAATEATEASKESMKIGKESRRPASASASASGMGSGMGSNRRNVSASGSNRNSASANANANANASASGSASGSGSGSVKSNVRPGGGGGTGKVASKGKGPNSSSRSYAVSNELEVNSSKVPKVTTKVSTRSLSSSEKRKARIDALRGAVQSMEKVSGKQPTIPNVAGGQGNTKRVASKPPLPNRPSVPRLPVKSTTDILGRRPGSRPGPAAAAEDGIDLPPTQYKPSAIPRPGQGLIRARGGLDAMAPTESTMLREAQGFKRVIEQVDGALGPLENGEL